MVVVSKGHVARRETFMPRFGQAGPLPLRVKGGSCGSASGAMSPVVFVLVATLAMFVAGAPARADGERTYPYKIVCTTGMVADIVRNVAGDKGEVHNIIGDGVDPHLYQATRGDIGLLLGADIIFYNGLMLEGKMGDALVRVARSRPVFAVTELIDESLLLEPPEFDGHYDPHVWMDVSLWREGAELVARTLGEFDSSNAGYYRSNYELYARQLDELDAYAKKALGSIPERSRVLITAHDAFNYLGRRYGIEVRGIQGISTESEAGIDDINQLVNLIVERDIRAVFVETSVSDKNVRSLMEGARARGHRLDMGGQLFSDAMGRPGTYEGTYIGMIDHNVTVITRALGGQAPEKGMNGRLAGANNVAP
jgi:manganese/zinc/iron transport system substrate-binding protein